MKKILILITLFCSLGHHIQGQDLDIVAFGTWPTKVEIGMAPAVMSEVNMNCHVLFGFGWSEKPYFYLGADYNVQLYPGVQLNVQAFPYLSTKHRDQVERGNNMVGDELGFGIRFRSGPQYIIQLRSNLDLIMRAGLELECPVLFTKNAENRVQVHGYVGLGVVFHAL